MTIPETNPVPQWKRWRNRVITQRVKTPDPELQLALPEGPDPELSAELRTIAARFAAFHRAHPEVYATLHASALAEWAAGSRRISVKGLWEELRRTGSPTGSDGSRYKLNNIYTRCYADLLAEDPRLAPCIERRVRKAQ